MGIEQRAAHEVSRFGHVELEELPEDLQARLAPIAEKSGFLPNVFRAFGRRPEELRAFMDYHDALMEREGGLSKAERELVVVTDSAGLGEDDMQAARDAGLEEEEIWDVGAIAAFFAMSNRMAHLTALQPNPEFFAMGRQPRS